MGKNNARLTNIPLILSAGIDPKTRLPIYLSKMKGNQLPNLKQNANIFFRVIDEARAVNRYKWTGLPYGISSQELERIIYYKGRVCFFYCEEMDRFFITPFALDGSIDFLGRYNSIRPVPMANGTEEKNDRYDAQSAILTKMKLKVQHDVIVFAEDLTEDVIKNSAVIIQDYTNQLPQEIIPRFRLNDDLIQMEAECLCFLRTNLILNTGVKGLRVADADSYAEAETAAARFYNSAIEGNPYTAITGKIEFQDLQSESTYKASEYFLAMQSLDNILLAGYGIENSGIYEKKAHINESEYAVNATNVSLVAQDGLTWRQHACNIINSIYDLGIWCELSETVSGADINRDGVEYEEDNGTVPATDPEVVQGGEE